MRNLSILFSTIAIIITLSMLSLQSARAITTNSQNNKITWWKFQSVDTVKYSRDIAREKADDFKFEEKIDAQLKAIAETGATHVAIATPYDDEFVPFLTKWVITARKHNLNVWFRGNFSGWEGWFDYEKISREQHLEKTIQFIKNNAVLFADGDIFTACPECENGGPGDPRVTRDIEGFRNFLISEYRATQSAFFRLNKGVLSNFNSMNGDVAKLVMDKKTTQALGGVVTIDHYVKSPKKLTDDISILAEKSGGKIVLGEFGAPIPDIHGKLTEEEQAIWIGEALDILSEMPAVHGINYWTNTGSSTQLWDEKGNPTLAVQVLTKHFKPNTLQINITDELGSPIKTASVKSGTNSYKSNNIGRINIPYIRAQNLITIKAEGFKTQETSIERLIDTNSIVLIKEHENIIFKLRKLLLELISKIKQFAR